MPSLATNTFKTLRQSLIRVWELSSSSIHDLKQGPMCDFWLVCHTKDRRTAILTIESITMFSLNPIGTIFLISNEINKPDWVPQYVTYIYEGLLPVTSVAAALLHRVPYKGWVLQQLLKYSGASYSELFVVIDCDTVLLKPHLFFTDEGTVFRLSYEHSPHYKMFEKSLSIVGGRIFSFTCHMMPYNSNILRELARRIEIISGQHWDEYICTFAERFGMCVNEQDLYARFAIQFGENYDFQPWLNKTLDHRHLSPINELAASFPRRNSISFHNNEKRPLILNLDKKWLG